MDNTSPRPGRRLPVKILVCAFVGALVLGLFVLPAFATPTIVTRTFNVYFVVDGEVIAAEVSSGFSLLNALDEAGIVLGEVYRQAEMLRRPVSQNEVFRAEFRDTDGPAVRSTVPYEVVRVPTSIFSEGTVMRLNYGRPGVREGRYGTLVLNGTAVGSVLRSETIVEEPVHSRVLVGTPGARVSPFNFNWERCENGRPVGYVTRLTNQRATAYSDRVGTITSTGQRAAVGLVAVNPQVIPYGSLLYITTECGTFVYGYAVAADTGGDLLRGRIDIDLFFDSHLETIHHGRRTVNIYILRLPE